MTLQDRFSMPQLFGDFCAALAERYPISRAGVVRSNLVDEEFEMVAQWYADPERVAVPGRRIPRDGTVGDWVLRHRRGFVGASIEDVRDFPATLLDFEDEGFQSNFVDFVDPQRLLLFFALSELPNAFAEPEQLREQLAVLPHCISLAEHWEMPGMEETLRSKMESLMLDLWGRFAMVPSQGQLEAAYYRSLLVITSGRVEGPNGAAALAGLKPSTLRSRMARTQARSAQEGSRTRTQNPPGTS